jgi:16S rRNA (cytosine967-C5)-methyltransferase
MAWADRVLHAETERLSLDRRDRALAMQLAFGAVKHCRTLDYLIGSIASRPVEQIAPPALASIRLGVYQLVFLDRVPAHAVVSDGVALVKAEMPKAAGFTNAVLRRASNEARAQFAALKDSTPKQAALRYSHQDWMTELFWDLFGAEGARELLAANNESSETCLRANTLKTSINELADKLPVEYNTFPALPEAFVLAGAFDVFGSPLWQEGLYMPQSRAAIAVSHVLDPQPGEKVLDLCAAPGGKTTHIAALMENKGSITAVEKNPGRARALAEIVNRMGVNIVDVHVADATVAQAGTFDRVLVDPPCSDLGTLRSRPDLRWRKTADLPAKLAPLQAEILNAGAAVLKLGGVLVYSTCTLTPRENEEVIRSFLKTHSDFVLDDLRSKFPFWQHSRMPECLQTLPHRDQTDGFFIARLRRGER